MIDITKFEGHTAGPWHTDRHGRINCLVGDVERAVADSRCWGWLMYVTGGAKIQDANARLIAAAPDLLAEVIRLRTTLYSIDRQLGHDDVDDALRDEITAALEGGAA